MWMRCDWWMIFFSLKIMGGACGWFEFVLFGVFGEVRWCSPRRAHGCATDERPPRRNARASHCTNEDSRTKHTGMRVRTHVDVHGEDRVGDVVAQVHADQDENEVFHQPAYGRVRRCLGGSVVVGFIIS